MLTSATKPVGKLLFRRGTLAWEVKGRYEFKHMRARAVVSSDPLTWARAEAMHSFFILKTGKEEIPVNCDFLCYVRQGDKVQVEGEIKKEQPINASYKIEGRYLYAKDIEDKTLGIRFMRQ